MFRLPVVRSGIVAVAAVLSAAVSMEARAQGVATPRPLSIDTVLRPAANPVDVGSIDGIVAAIYAAISGAAGEKRDWNRFRSLFVPNARLIPSRVRPDGSSDAFIFSVDDYATRVAPGFERDGFYEREIARRVETYGAVTHVFSTYESRRLPSDPKPFARGINSIQLLKDGARYWVVTVFWDSERPGNELPAKYLPPPE